MLFFLEYLFLTDLMSSHNFSNLLRQQLEKPLIWRQSRSNPEAVLAQQAQTKGKWLTWKITIKMNLCTQKREEIPSVNNWRAWWTWKDQKCRNYSQGNEDDFADLEDRLSLTSQQQQAEFHWREILSDRFPPNKTTFQGLDIKDKLILL